MAIKRAMGFSNLDMVIKNLNREVNQIQGRSIKGVLKAALFIEGQAKKRTPIVTGNLKNSAYTKKKGNGAEIGFTAAYAPFVHENPRAGKTGGVSPKGVKYKAPMLPSGRRSTAAAYSTVGGWKFLQIPLQRYTSNILKIIYADARIK